MHLLKLRIPKSKKKNSSCASLPVSHSYIVVCHLAFCDCVKPSITDLPKPSLVWSMSRIPPMDKSTEQTLIEYMREFTQEFAMRTETFISRLRRDRYDDQQGMQQNELRRLNRSPPPMSTRAYNYPRFNEQQFGNVKVEL